MARLTLRQSQPSGETKLECRLGIVSNLTFLSRGISLGIPTYKSAFVIREEVLTFLPLLIPEPLILCSLQPWGLF